MNLQDYIPAVVTPAYAYIGKQDWLELIPLPDGTLSIDKREFERPVNQPLLATVIGVIENGCESPNSAGSPVVETWMISKGLADGPKVIRPTENQCRLSELIDPAIPFSEYHQPYPAFFVEVPPEYRKELSERFNRPCPRHILICHDEISGVIGVTILFPTEFAFSLYRQRLGRETVVQSLEAGLSDTSEQHQYDILARLAVNLSLLLISNGVKVLGPANPQRIKKLQQSAKHKKHNKAARAAESLEFEPVVIGFQQEVNFFTTDETEPADESTRRTTGEGRDRKLETRPRLPHWRRGYIRNQRVGKGRTQIETRFIPPKFINARLFSGNLASTIATYIGKTKPKKNGAPKNPTHPRQLNPRRDQQGKVGADNNAQNERSQSK